jgi:hypothetical protein
MAALDREKDQLLKEITQIEEQKQKVEQEGMRLQFEVNQAKEEKISDF